MGHIAKTLSLCALIFFGVASPSIDLWVSSRFFPFEDSPFLDAIYLLGPVPGWVVIAGASAGLFLPKYREWRRIFLYLIATLAIGSGIIVHAVFKETWGRPRPKQIVEFGGKDHFQPFYWPNIETGESKHRSFTSGHVTMGFFFFTFYFIGKKLKSRRLQHFGIAFSFFLGALLTYARIAQGGHFFSDAIGSMAVMFLTAYFLSPILENERSYAETS